MKCSPGMRYGKHGSSISNRPNVVWAIIYYSLNHSNITFSICDLSKTTAMANNWDEKNAQLHVSAHQCMKANIEKEISILQINECWTKILVGLHNIN